MRRVGAGGGGAAVGTPLQHLVVPGRDRQQAFAARQSVGRAGEDEEHRSTGAAGQLSAAGTRLRVGVGLEISAPIAYEVEGFHCLVAALPLPDILPVDPVPDIICLAADTLTSAADTHSPSVLLTASDVRFPEHVSLMPHEAVNFPS